MKFKVIDTRTGEEINTESFVLKRDGQLTWFDDDYLENTNLIAIFPEVEELKAQLEKWKQFYEALSYCMDGWKDGAINHTHKNDIARGCGLEV